VHVLFLYARSLGTHLNAVILQVVVQAVDDSTGYTATTEVVVMVTDVNDNAPSFPEFPVVSIREGRLPCYCSRLNQFVDFRHFSL